MEEGVSEVLGATQVEEGVSEVLGATEVEVGSGVDEVWGASYKSTTGQRWTIRNHPDTYGSGRSRSRGGSDKVPVHLRESSALASSDKRPFYLPGRHQPTGRQSG